MRLFFDYITKDQPLLDYRGHEFPSCRGVVEFAEAIADDLKNSLTEDWIGCSIEVRNVEGCRILSLPIGVPDLRAV